MNSEIVKTKMLVTIIDSDKDSKIKRLLKRHNIRFSFVLNGTGTASSSLLNYFGLEEVKKKVIVSVIPVALEDKILYDLYNKAALNEPGGGISFTINITSATRFLSNIYSGINLKKGDSIMDNNKEYELVVLIVLEGYASLAMDAAKRCGANGGTLIHGLGLGTAESTKFLGITIEPEKDIVLVLVKKEDKKKVMKEISDAVGLSHDGRGICFSLPVDNVTGLNNNLKN